MKEDNNYIEQLKQTEFYYNKYLNVILKQECATKTLMGEHCPEIGTHQIGDDEYLCDRCYNYWLQIKK